MIGSWLRFFSKIPVYEIRGSHPVKILLLFSWAVTPCGLVRKQISPDDSLFLQKGGIYLQVHSALHLRRSTSTKDEITYHWLNRDNRACYVMFTPMGGRLSLNCGHQRWNDTDVKEFKNLD